MPITAQLHDGTRLEFPDGTDPAVIQSTVKNLLAGTPKQAPEGTSPSQLKGSVAGGVFMGLRDPIDAGAQLLARGVNSAVGGINSITGLNIPRPDVAGVDKIVNNANAEYDASREMNGRGGVDLARIAGNIVNPVNRIVPIAGAASTAGVVGRAALQGGISGLAQPVVGDTSNFYRDKATQAGIGAAAGAAGGYAADKAGNALATKFAELKQRPGFPQALGGQAQMPVMARTEQQVNQAAAANGINLADIPGNILDDVKRQVVAALQKGKTVDAGSLIRNAKAKSLLGEDAGLMTGQASRDPQAFARGLDLRGIQGAGKPIADRLALQNERLIGAVGKMGGKGAPDAYDAGAGAIKSLQATDNALSADVTAAYNKFRNASGSTYSVPLQPLAQKLGDVLDTFGKRNIPDAVMSHMKEYGLTGTKQTKVFDLLEADKLIKTINANYDPMLKAQKGALDELRKGLQDSIDLADSQSQGMTGPAADMLKEALGKAKARFKLHETVPGLDAAANDSVAQEAFIRKYITSQSAGVDQVNSLTKLLSPDAMDGVRRNVLTVLLDKAAPGASSGSDAAKFSQAGFRKALDGVGDRKLTALFGKDGVQQLRDISQVSQWIQTQPSGSAVNNSNTGAALMNLLQGAGGKSNNPIVQKLMSLPGANMVKNSVSQSLDESAVRKALAAEIRPQSPQVSPEDINALRRLLPVTSGALGGSAASSLR